MAIEIKNGVIFSEGAEVLGVSAKTNEPLESFVKAHKKELESYGKDKSNDTILTYLIRKDVVIGSVSSVQLFAEEWRKEGVTITV